MLKELWRKTMGYPEINPNDASDVDQPLSLSSRMTHTGELHLERLTYLIEQRFGRTFKCNTDDGIRELIHYASRIQDQDIQREFLLFYLNCSPDVQDYLRSGDIVNDDHLLSKTSGNPST
ncbi:MAG: hypothetical protein WD623_16055 [Marinobacter sp.]|uniref:hypothetical protein n=1 Tax=Marinobacter sp. TaxID=50741 RepID=UPI0034A08F09